MAKQLAELGARLHQAVQMSARGLLAKEAAWEAGLAMGTVKQYRSKAARQLGCSARELPAKYFQEKLRGSAKENATRLSEWMKNHGAGLRPDAKVEMESIIAGIVMDSVKL